MRQIRPAETYKANAEAYLEKLEALDSERSQSQQAVIAGMLFSADVLPMVISFTVMAWSMRAFMTAVRRIRSRAWHRWRM